MPICYKRYSAIPTKDAVTVIASDVPESISAKLVPSQPKYNLSFMIDMQYLDNWKPMIWVCGLRTVQNPYIIQVKSRKTDW